MTAEKPPTPQFTLAIPTYNGAKRLPLVLARLREQVEIAHLNWQVLVVDNNSTDNTAQVVQEYQAQWLDSVPLCYVFEAHQGAAFARQRAIREASSTWVGFLDDDILAEPDWVAKAWEFTQQHPQVAVFGGQIHGQFEVPPPRNFKRIESFLAIRRLGARPRLYQPETLLLPPSASWVVNRQAWLSAVPQEQKLSGRIKGSMMQGDDYEPLLHLHRAGWEIWYNPAMRVYHQIPRQRLERDYLLAISRGCGRSICQLRMINAPRSQKWKVLVETLFGQELRRALRFFIKNYRQFKTDLVTECEMAFHIGRWESGWFCLSQNLFTKNRQ